ncbi:hypothetical protein SCP_0803970 [Sparassis crispa]|uniref:Uncharacterized protein n=1 Tax=Sparassis crispa TaxID=139825 RepID=A0A401GUG4_9APHY|nr:hypothetical protein SCP_0803970 [Sparassis crispa]GBE85875.1 hypothetical protein SCP_0803970 [Sparassis crispa]
MQDARSSRAKRAPNRWNAYLSAELKRFNAALPSGQTAYKSNSLPFEIKAKWDAMSPEERITITDPLLKNLQDQRETKQLAVQNVPINAFHDVRSNLASVQEQLEALHARTGTEILMIAVRSSNDHYNRPHVFFTSDRLSDFFTVVLRTQLADVAMQMESYCLSGIQGLVSRSRDQVAELKARINKMIYDKLRAAAEVEVPRMYYTNFEKKITEKHAVVIEGWPLGKFCPPSDLRSRTELEVLYKAWETSETRFHKMSRAKYETWDDSRFRAALENGHDNDELPVPVTAVSLRAPNWHIHRGLIHAGGARVVPDGVPTHSQALLGSPVVTSTVVTSTAVTSTASTTRKRPADAAANSSNKRRKQGPFQDFINVVSGVGGELVAVTKKPRATRKDKGVPRKKKAKGPTNDENGMPSSGNAPANIVPAHALPSATAVTMNSALSSGDTHVISTAAVYASPSAMATTNTTPVSTM